MMKAGHNQKEIAKLLERSPSTISRELKRNKGLKGYRPAQAQRLTDTRRTEATKFIKIRDKVWSWIEQELSPQQVVDYLKRHKNISLHHETVYQLIYLEKSQGGTLYHPPQSSK